MANVKVFFKSRSKVTVKVTSSKFMVPSEGLSIRITHAKYGLSIRITHAKYERLISKGKKVMANVKVFDGQTDRRTDKVITIGHPPSGGAPKRTKVSTLKRFILSRIFTGDALKFADSDNVNVLFVKKS